MAEPPLFAQSSKAQVILVDRDLDRGEPGTAHGNSQKEIAAAAVYVVLRLAMAMGE